jgi:hypothetical protein
MSIDFFSVLLAQGDNSIGMFVRMLHIIVQDGEIGDVNSLIGHFRFPYDRSDATERKEG